MTVDVWWWARPVVPPVPVAVVPARLTGERRGGHRRHAALTFLRALVIAVVAALVVSALLQAFVGQMFVIPSASMQGTLLQGDRVLVQKVTDFHRGQVVVLEDRAGWLPGPEAARPTDGLLDSIRVAAATSPGHLVKRVIGMPGDRVVCCADSGRVTVNGQALDERAYLYTSSTGKQVAPSTVRFTVVVPRGHVFVMGDHRDDGADSRCHLSDPSAQGTGQTAFVPESDVVGPAVAILSPFDRAGRLPVPATFARVPDPSEPAPERGEIKPSGVTCS
jgi:signal peptidase I